LVLKGLSIAGSRVGTRSEHRGSGPVSFSVLDLSPIAQGCTAADAFRNTLDLARHAETWGYRRFWLAEHHNVASIASAATAILIGHVAGGTSSIRVGSGGIMLPNHAPLIIAEQFGTLASLYPNRIDLGVGRAAGADPVTARALRRDPVASANSFPYDLQELQLYFETATPQQKISAIPGAGLQVPIWLLGSSKFSAELAATLGLPFSFAAHFAPDQLLPALQIYRTRFQPSPALIRPYAMLAVNVIAADTDAQARRLFTSQQQDAVNLARDTPLALPPPVDDIDAFWTAAEKASITHAMTYSIVGSPETVRRGLQDFIKFTSADELILNTYVHDHAARLRSFEIVAGLRDHLGAEVSSESPAGMFFGNTAQS
jgi:luciferase family oxidoreductase group 1